MVSIVWFLYIVAILFIAKGCFLSCTQKGFLK
jgi:hypothetical protein